MRPAFGTGKEEEDVGENVSVCTNDSDSSVFTVEIGTAAASTTGAVSLTGGKEGKVNCTTSSAEGTIVGAGIVSGITCSTVFAARGTCTDTGGFVTVEGSRGVFVTMSGSFFVGEDNSVTVAGFYEIISYGNFKNAILTMYHMCSFQFGSVAAKKNATRALLAKEKPAFI